MDGARIDVRTGERGEVVVVVSGEIDMRTHEKLFESLRAAALGTGADGRMTAEGRVRKVTVDLSGTIFLDSGGIGVLVAGGNAARAVQVDYEIIGVHGMVRRVMEITGVLYSLTGERPPG